MILCSARSLDDLLSDILSLSKLENARYEPHPDVVELEPFVEGVVNVISLEAKKKGVQFRYDGPPETFRVVVVDSIALRHALWNLLSNALKFTEKGGVTLQVDAQEAGPGVAGLRVRVTDTGVGIAASRIDSIFDDFVQEDSSTTRQFGDRRSVV